MQKTKKSLVMFLSLVPLLFCGKIARCQDATFVQYPAIKKVQLARFIFDPIGRPQKDVRESPALNLPPAVELLLDEDYVETLSVHSDAVNYLRKRVTDIRNNVYSLETEAFESEIKSLNSLVKQSVAVSDQRKIQYSLAAAAFYANGPVEFAKRIGLSDRQQLVVRRNCSRVKTALEKKLRSLEDRILTEYFQMFDEEISTVLMSRLLNETCSPERKATTSILWHSLHHDFNEIDSSDADISVLQYYFVVSTAGYLARNGERKSDPFSDASILFSAQGWDIKNDQSIRLHWASLGDRRLVIQRQFVDDRKKIRETTSRKISKKKLEILSNEYSKQQMELAEELTNEFTKEEKIQFESCRLLSAIQRLGPVEALQSEFAGKCLGLSLDESDMARVAHAARQLASELKSECEKIQSETVEQLFEGIDVADQLNWADASYPFGVPPLEVLLYQCSLPRGKNKNKVSGAKN